MIKDYKLNNNSGTLFKNSEKKNENSPDRSGNAVIDGKSYYINAWIRTTQDGKQYLGLSFRERIEDTEE